MRSSNYYRNGNDRWSSSREGKHYKIDSNENRLNVGSVPDTCSGCFVSSTVALSDIDPIGQEQAVGSGLRRGRLRLSIAMGQVEERRGILHCKVLVLKGVSVGTASPVDRNGHAARVRNVLLSQAEMISPATATGTEVEGTVRDTFGRQ